MLKYSRISVLLLSFALSSFGAELLSDAGKVRCGGLFLWKGVYASADAEACNVADTVKSAPIGVYARASFARLHTRWRNFWTSRLTAKEWNAGAGIYGDFPLLFLDAQVSGDTAHLQASATSSLHTKDSIAYAGAEIGGGSFGTLHYSWTSETPGSLIDTLNADYEGKFVNKAFFGGGKFKRHEWRAQFGFIETSRSPIGDNELYAIRDSSLLRKATAEYTYSATDSKIRILIYHLDLDAHIFGLRTKDGDTKKFMFVPAEAELNGAEESLRYGKWDFGLGYAQGYLKVPETTARFEETFAANRLLGNSTLKILSFSFYKKNYRVFGDADAKFAHAKIQKRWDIGCRRWRIAPEASGDFFFIKGGTDLILQDETTVLFAVDKNQTPYTGDFKVAGSLLGLRAKVSSPAARFFADVKMQQLVPFYLKKNFESDKGNSSGSSTGTGGSTGSGSGPSGTATSSTKNQSFLMKEEKITPFRAGFSIDASVGFAF